MPVVDIDTKVFVKNMPALTMRFHWQSHCSGGSSGILDNAIKTHIVPLLSLPQRIPRTTELSATRSLFFHLPTTESIPSILQSRYLSRTAGTSPTPPIIQKIRGKITSNDLTRGDAANVHSIATTCTATRSAETRSRTARMSTPLVAMQGLGQRPTPRIPAAHGGGGIN
ncbi:hypothetical protein BCR34DRAFT_42631 [Clohesyomyces aquaticus]|uniref:Uncharacterized protein n=1 Tax=Clohesyomyces aquaticus TaxID=1231657 RepID=A0A1Y1Z6A9_9PLEO|nr:hypothetical protein BCR34DRAFT_42631 [Clohesyomyces aquaticus]